MRTHVSLLRPWFNTGRRQRSPQHASVASNAQVQTCNTQGRTCRATATRWKPVCTHKEFRSVNTEGHKEPRRVHTRDTKNPVGYTQVHDRNKSTTQTHEETRRVHTRKRACECKCAADGPPTPSGVRTQANSLHESCLGTGGTARVLCQSYPSRCHQTVMCYSGQSITTSSTYP